MPKKTPPITEEAVLNALKKISIKGKITDLVTSGQVSGIVIKDGHVAFSLEITPDNAATNANNAADAADSIQPLRHAAEDAVNALPGVLSATAMLTAHRKTPPTQTPPKTPPQAHQAAHQTAPQAAPPQARLHSPAKYVVAVASGKGGVGKSTTAINLALAFKNHGYNTGLLDADIYGPSLPRLTGIKTKPKTRDNKLVPINAFGLKVMSIGFLMEEDTPTIWRGPMVMSALEQMLRDVLWGDPHPLDILDILVIDMPPGTGDAQLTLSQRAKLAGAVIVSTPQDLALIDARKGLNMFRKVSVPVLGLIENMSAFTCPDCGSVSHIFGKGGAEAEAKKLNLPFLGKVPLEIAIRETADAGTPIVETQPNSPHAKAYMDIAAKVLDSLKDAQPPAPEIIIN